MRHSSAQVVELEPDGTSIFPSAQPTTIGGSPIQASLCSRSSLFNGTPCSTGAMDPNFHQPFAAEWNLDIQRAITNNLTLDVAYVGNHGLTKNNMIDLNQPA